MIGYNHSCDPNAYVDGQIALRTMRPVEEGEEITVDYATVSDSDTQAFACLCGSEQCRHSIKPSLDSQDPLLRSKYAGYFADFLARPDAYIADLVPIDPDCPITSWLTTKASRVDAKIHGLGLAANAAITKGELLAVRGGTLVTKDVVVSRQDELKGSEIQITDTMYLAGFTEQERLATLLGFNHSCVPNSYLGGQIAVFAMQDIAADSELTIDYATAYVSPSQRFDCNCGTAHCRGFVDTTVDWQNSDLQNRYKGYFGSFIQRMIDADAVSGA